MLTLVRIAPFAAAVVLAGSAAPASALVVSSGPQGLDLTAAGGDRADVTLALVDAGGATRYRVDVPRPSPGQSTMSAGAGCAMPSEDVAICDRSTRRIEVTLGDSEDTFTVDPAFPDPITIAAGRGRDLLRLGAGDDVVESATDEVFGEGGDDTMTAVAGSGVGLSVMHGGSGDDTMTARSGFSTMYGDEGDDALTVKQSDVPFTGGTLVGGPGKDAFRLNGRGTIDARDGVAETVLCSDRRGAGPRQDTTRATIDPADTLHPALPNGGCSSVDRAPRGERTVSRLVTRLLRVDKARRVGIRVRCETRPVCAGTITVRVGNGSDRHSKRYRVARGTAVTIPVGLTPTAVRKIGGARTVATVTLSEKGTKGARSVERRVPIRGRGARG